MQRRLKLLAVAVWAATTVVGGAAAINAAGLSKTQPGSPSGTGTDAGVPVVTSAEEARELGGLLPDIVEAIPTQLGIHNQQQSEVLRFSTIHWNVGEGNLQIRGGGQVGPCVLDGVNYDLCTHSSQEILNADGEIVAQHPAGVALYHPEHNHWHQNGVASFEIRKTPGGSSVVPSGYKTTFCLVDTDRIENRIDARVYWECNSDLQGISTNWGDKYHQSTPGQELDITGLEGGVYYLTHDADPDGHWVESDDSNNAAWVKFRLVRKGANPKIEVLDTFGPVA
jgi:hypothetical protein